MLGGSEPEMLGDSNQKCWGDPNQKWWGIRARNVGGDPTQKWCFFSNHDGWGLQNKSAKVLDWALLQWRLSLANHSPSNSSCKTRGAPQNASYKSELPENKFLSQSPKHRLFTHSKVPRLHLGWFTTFAPPAASITNRRSLFFFLLWKATATGTHPAPQTTKIKQNP